MILRTPGERVNDDVFSELVPLILNAGRIDRGAPNRSIVVIDSMRLQPVLTAWYRRQTSVTTANVHTKLGTTRDEVEKAKLVLFIVHGPFTERIAEGARLYSEDGEMPRNQHWSLIAWSPTDKHAYHYDSAGTINYDRCAEILGVLRKYRVIPEDTLDFSNPEYFPQQQPDDAWTCGYYVLAAINIIARKVDITPLTQDDISSYWSHFETMSNPRSSTFRSYLYNMFLYNGCLLASSRRPGDGKGENSDSDSSESDSE